MRIRWENVCAVVFLVALVYVVARHGRRVETLVGNAFSPEAFQPQNQIVSLMVFGLIIVLIVAIISLLTSGRK